jgi:spore cortex biosynthesis protein YabQ
VEPASPHGLAQLFSFLEATGLGALLAFCFDLYRALCSQTKRYLPKIILFAADCLFWVVAALSCIAVIIFLMWGEIYYYSYLGLAAGFGLYLLSISRFLLPFWNRVFAAVLRCLARLMTAIGRIIRMLMAPVYRVARLSGVAAGGFGPAIKRLAGRIFGRPWRK